MKQSCLICFCNARCSPKCGKCNQKYHISCLKRSDTTISECFVCHTPFPRTITSRLPRVPGSRSKVEKQRTYWNNHGYDMCVGCGTVIEKIYGCNTITCPNCDISFQYRGRRPTNLQQIRTSDNLPIAVMIFTIFCGMLFLYQMQSWTYEDSPLTDVTDFKISIEKVIEGIDDAIDKMKDSFQQYERMRTCLEDEIKNVSGVLSVKFYEYYYHVFDYERSCISRIKFNSDVL